MIFADASALIALIVGEEDATDLADRLETHADRLCSALGVWETAAGLCRSYKLLPAEARELVQEFLKEAGFRFVDLGEREWQLAHDAYARYGKGRHPAALNMGDCFAYACAKAQGAALLYKGEDFKLTDLA
ncbi:ribonuclease VapC [Nitrospirillum amazonense]|uniref:Ribonuclease VapC n=1 Tax=Nitrospirillum amazonense TaxID=28077 RepID=A0A560FFP4_9PROT|nr:type II toxin-antitoxin system VapC family toxin [Nitrospirillum amazonense]TWB20424.1 ribonuclease VapC [Nitrospirillum amazonense]